MPQLSALPHSFLQTREKRRWSADPFIEARGLSLENGCQSPGEGFLECGLGLRRQGKAGRCVLQNLPGRAPELYRRLGAAGEPAVHLLSRLLTFDPSHRATAAEALCHEYFAGDDASFGQSAARQPAKPGAAPHFHPQPEMPPMGGLSSFLAAVHFSRGDAAPLQPVLSPPPSPPP